MDAEQARTAIVTSGLVTFSAWAYRKLIEPVQSPAPSEEHNRTLTAFVGAGHEPANTAQFAVGFGFTYVSLAVMATFAPDVAGSFAIVVAVGVVLVNGTHVFEDVTHQVSTTTSTEGGTVKKAVAHAAKAKGK